MEIHLKFVNFDSSNSKYDTLSEIEKRKREFVCRGAEVKLRLIVQRTCTCGVISHFYRNKLDVAERGDGGPGGEGLGGRSRASSPPPPPASPGAEALSGSFSAARRSTIKCNFPAAPQAGKERFFCLICRFANLLITFRYY